MKKIVKTMILLSIIMIAITCIACVYVYKNTKKADVVVNDYIIDINEIKQLQLKGETDIANEKLNCLQKNMRDYDASGNMPVVNICMLLGGSCIIFMIIILTYVYIRMIKPFEKMESYASEIAKGNLDVKLDYSRSNYFGAFTWAFDCMRNEIIKSRECEQAAIENNKTIIASLSHDIRTPLSLIRAYAEGMEANLDKSLEKRHRYIKVIINKCDEVTKITNDLLLHSVADMDKLTISLEKTDIVECLAKTVEELQVEKDDIIFYAPQNTIYTKIDENRFSQIIENIIGNSRKYAKTDISIEIKENDDNVVILIRDYGEGIPNEDVPFIFDRFYRGKNTKAENGTGLGLYIVNYITKQMGGSVTIDTSISGAMFVLTFPICNP